MRSIVSISLLVRLYLIICLVSCSEAKFAGADSIVGDSIWMIESKANLKKMAYSGEVTPEKRYIALGFDDFRTSDFSLVIPLLNKYGAKAEFNRIHYFADVTDEERQLVEMVLNNGHELGDHTWKHYSYIFDAPLFNGQNPDSPEGNQVPFPSNSQLRDDVGNGKNAFGHMLSEPVKVTLGSQAPSIDATWSNLTDEECQYIREYFSVMKDRKDIIERTPLVRRLVDIDDNSDLIDILDNLSNTYLGTSGSSNGSWSREDGCYKGGIFTGCKTSANHEIWERILMVTKLFVQDKFHVDLYTWSWPGSKSSMCVFPSDGKLYYDSQNKQLFNNLAKFTSSLFRTKDGEYKTRSWTDVLKKMGYLSTHDATYPGRRDGQTLPCMSYQYIMNASQSRPDALIYSTNRCIDYSKIASEYEKDKSFIGKESHEAQMYDRGGTFRDAIETWRKHTANGIIWGEVIDSEDTWSEGIILEGLLKYGTTTGIEFVTKSEAYDISFNHSLIEGNLIYNPHLRNTAKEFLPESKTVPSNPDGYEGDCSVENEDDIPVLVTNDTTVYHHFGIPCGNIHYEAVVKGKGFIRVRFIKNSTDINSIGSSELVCERKIDSEKQYCINNMDFTVPANDMTPYEQRCAGWGNMIIGVRLEYSGGLRIKNIKMCKK